MFRFLGSGVSRAASIRINRLNGEDKFSDHAHFADLLLLAYSPVVRKPSNKSVLWTIAPWRDLLLDILCLVGAWAQAC